MGKREVEGLDRLLSMMDMLKDLFVDFLKSKFAFAFMLSIVIGVRLTKEATEVTLMEITIGEAKRAEAWKQR